MVMMIALVLALPLAAAGAKVFQDDPGGAALIWSAAGLVIGLAWLTPALHIHS